MGFFLGVLLTSFALNSILLVPFINFLYKIRLQRQLQKTKDAFDKPTPIFDKLHQRKIGTPIGGGLIVILNTTLIFLLSFPVMYYFWIPITTIYHSIGAEIKILLFSYISFGLIGLYDDIKKVFFGKADKFFGLRMWHKFALESILALAIGYWLYADLKITILNIPMIGVYNIGWLYIFYAAFVILSFANAFNITDGLDGLASGILMIALVSFWVISHAILDTPLSLFIATWLGGIVAFLYFNVHPARIFLGDVGALSFGATFAVVGLLLGKSFVLIIIGGLYIAEITSSFIQLMSKKYLGRKIMKVAPFHLYLQEKGWMETTVVFRAWLASIILALFGLWLTFTY